MSNRRSGGRWDAQAPGLGGISAWGVLLDERAITRVAGIAARELRWVGGIKRSPPGWIENLDGTFGPCGGTADATGGHVATILRLGGKIDHPERVIAVMKNGQKADGGFGYSGQTSNLESSYRIMRSLHMLKAKPAAPERVRAFIARCRNTDGGYGVVPDQLSSAAGTYFAAIILHWLEEK